MHVILSVPAATLLKIQLNDTTVFNWNNAYVRCSFYKHIFTGKVWVGKFTLMKKAETFGNGYRRSQT